MQHPRLRGGSILAALFLTIGCTPPPAQPVNDQDAIENAINDDINITDADDDRADRLDEKAEELRDQANVASDAAATALRNEARDDVAAAAAIRRQGTSDGDQSEDNAERKAGLLNGN